MSTVRVDITTSRSGAEHWSRTQGDIKRDGERESRVGAAVILGLSAN